VTDDARSWHFLFRGSGRFFCVAEGVDFSFDIATPKKLARLILLSALPVCLFVPALLAAES
jgi:hypothetical protein